MNPQYRNQQGWPYYSMIQKQVQGRMLDSPEEIELKKSLGIDSLTTGSEFIPESYSADVIWQIYENSWARQLFGTHVLRYGVKENIPKFTTKLVEASGVSSPIDALPTELTSTTSIEAATMTTGEVELPLKTLALKLTVMRKWFAYNVDPNIEAEMRNEFANAMLECEEDIIVNGDTETSSSSNINYTYNSSSCKHGVNTATGDNEHLLLFNGIRKSAAGTAVDNSTAAFAASDFRELQKNLGVYARKGMDKLAYIISPDVHSAMLGFSQIETMEKYPNATIVTGQVGMIYGIRVIVTDKMPCVARGTLTDSTGVRGASGNNYTEFCLIYVPTLVIGAPGVASRNFRVEKDPEPQYDRDVLIAVEDFGIAIKYTDAICRAYSGTA